mmetsp:Transcript_27164/g.67753  ORF Transcript_27164/g.67753 Transcript_27164/m.67753 type:complete len:296 (-) Transcript_27164:568-1455(-)
MRRRTLCLRPLNCSSTSRQRVFTTSCSLRYLSRGRPSRCPSPTHSLTPTHTQPPAPTRTTPTATPPRTTASTSGHPTRHSSHPPGRWRVSCRPLSSRTALSWRPPCRLRRHRHRRSPAAAVRRTPLSRRHRSPRRPPFQTPSSSRPRPPSAASRGPRGDRCRRCCRHRCSSTSAWGCPTTRPRHHPHRLAPIPCRWSTTCRTCFRAHRCTRCVRGDGRGAASVRRTRRPPRRTHTQEPPRLASSRTHWAETSSAPPPPTHTSSDRRSFGCRHTPCTHTRPPPASAALAAAARGWV